MRPLSAQDRVKKIKKTIRGDEQYDRYFEHKLMENYSIGYNELMDFPYEIYLEMSRIMSIEEKEKKKERDKKEKEMNKKTSKV